MIQFNTRVLALGLLAIAQVHAVQLEKDEEVYILNQINFDEAMPELKTVLVEFYAPW